MAIVVPAIKGRLGNTDYYESKMKVRDLVTAVRPANELDEWETMSADEKMQREPFLKRIEKELGPYIANNPDRFFGSLIVLVFKGEIFFEGLTDFNTKIPKAYQAVARDLGFLTIDGGSLIVLDGQHRLLALEKVFRNEITGKYVSEIPNDEVSVIFINHENTVKTRRIFNKVNRYAKSTSKAENILTSEDDTYAIIARRLFHNDAPLENVVDFKSNTLSTRSTSLTTLSVVHETVAMLLHHVGKTINVHMRPSDEELDDCYEISEKYWTKLLENISPYKNALLNSSKIPEMRNENSPHSLLFKPAAQKALFKGLIMATERGLQFEEAVQRANLIDWSSKSSMWTDIIIRHNGTIDPKTDAKDRAADLISYLIVGEKMSEVEVEKLTEIYRIARGDEDEELPKFVLESKRNL